MITLPFSAHDFHLQSLALIAATRTLSSRGWTPATSSNFSARLDAKHAVITVSGRDKGQLTEADFMAVDMRGHAVASEHRPSAETLLHTQLYRHDAGIGCVLHTHSMTQTVASRYFARSGHVELAGYELLKAIDGVTTHDTAIRLPVLSNSQDMEGLAEAVGRREVVLVGETPGTVAELDARLRAEWPALAPHTFRVAVNQRYARDGDVVASGDEIALIPPVSGG